MKFKSFRSHSGPVGPVGMEQGRGQKLYITAEEVAKLKNYGFTENSSRTLKRLSKTISRTKPKMGTRERKPRTQNYRFPSRFVRYCRPFDTGTGTA